MLANAVVFTAPNTVEVLSVHCPDPRPSDVVVRTTHSWISNGTEGSYLRGERSDGDTPWRPGDPMPFPVVAGYQKIGVVEALGSDVRDLEIGETVFATIGLVNGMYHEYAGHVSPSVCPRHEVFKLPSGTEPLAFAGLVLAQVGYNGGMRAPAEARTGAVVVGDGLVGQWTAQTLSGRGAKVMLVGRHDDRLEQFASWPLALTINTRSHDWMQAARDHFPHGVRIGVDTIGDTSVMTDLQSVVRPGGHLVSAGFYGTDDLFALQPPRYKELSIHLISGWTRERLLAARQAIVDGHLKTLPMITHHFPVERAADAWKLIESKREPVLGVIFDW